MQSNRNKFETMDHKRFRQTRSLIADYYNGCKVGYVGPEGYRKSTDLVKFSRCIDELLLQGYIDPQLTIFLDLGCADGRVNVLMSYFVRQSIGIESDADILAESNQRSRHLALRLQRENLVLPPDNIALFHGNSLEAATYDGILNSTGVHFAQVDLFYTYITLHDLFAEKIATEAKTGALYLVYGFNKILPRYQGLELLISDVAAQGLVALYQ
ncbi:MAG: class I SAM-dependent methyltransferase, partial [Syntrophobacteria bacterium]